MSDLKFSSPGIGFSLFMTRASLAILRASGFLPISPEFDSIRSKLLDIQISISSVSRDMCNILDDGSYVKKI